MENIPLTHAQLVELLNNVNSYTKEQAVQEFSNYINIPRPINSVRMLNKEYRTIEYDDIEKNATHYNNLLKNNNTHNLNYTKAHYEFVNYIIYCNAYFYRNASNKPTWVRFKKDLYIVNQKFPQFNFNFNKSGYLKTCAFTVYYKLKIYRQIIPTMIRGINYMYSDECKVKDVLNHPLYGKGCDYYLTAIDACTTMIDELILTNGVFIKSFNTVIKQGYDINITPELTNLISTYIYFLLNGRSFSDRNNFEKFEKNTTIDVIKKKFKELTKIIYISMFNILQPCDFYTLYQRLETYYNNLKAHIYFHRLIKNIPDPEYMGSYFKLTAEIE